MNIGLFGGSFNPVHDQHLIIAETVRKRASLDEIWFLPVYRPVHKAEAGLLPFDRRCELLNAAIGRREGLICSDLERALGGPSFTIRLVRHVKEVFPRDRFFLVVGSDSLRDLPTWKDADRLAREIPFIIVTRPGVEGPGPVPNPVSRWVGVEPHPASSSAIRAALGRGRCRGQPVPAAAMARIVAQDLYGSLGPRYRRWIGAVRRRLAGVPAGIRGHLEGVARLTAEYAAAMGEDPRCGYLAGLAHDLFRLSEAAVLRRWMALGGRLAKGPERATPMLGHGLAAAGFLGRLRPPVPVSVLAAVRSHTFPRAGMSRLSMALVMGDALEPGRGKPELDALREADLPLEEIFRRVVERKRRRAQAKEIRARAAPPVADLSLPVPHE